MVFYCYAHIPVVLGISFVPIDLIVTLVEEGLFCNFDNTHYYMAIDQEASNGVRICWVNRGKSDSFFALLEREVFALGDKSTLVGSVRVLGLGWDPRGR